MDEHDNDTTVHVTEASRVAIEGQLYLVIENGEVRAFGVVGTTDREAEDELV